MLAFEIRPLKRRVKRSVVWSAIGISVVIKASIESIVRSWIIIGHSITTLVWLIRSVIGLITRSITISCEVRIWIVQGRWSI